MIVPFTKLAIGLSIIAVFALVPIIVPHLTQPVTMDITTNISSDSSSSSIPTPPPFDPAAAPDGKMTNCQKQQYWLHRSFVTGVNDTTDMLLALYYQRECKA